jgi:hypothetical protein
MNGMGFNVPQYAPVQKPPQEDMDYGVIGSALSGLGNLIDIPGSMVRDTISFSNPFDQLMTPFSSDNRTSGAEISRYWMGGDEDSGGNQMAGLMIDILTDPTVLLTGGTSAAARAGMRGGAAALKGLGKVGQAVKGGYRAGTNATTAGQLARTNRVLANKADDLYDTALQNLESPGTGWVQVPTGQGSKIKFRQGALPGPPSPNPSARAALNESMNYRNQILSDDQINEAVKRANRDIETRFNNATLPARTAAYRGADQFARQAYGGASTGLGFARDSAKNLGRQLMDGDRNAMLQSYGIGSNALQTATGQRMSDEPTLEDMIAQALMEDPALSEELLMMLGAGE